jgi:acyl-CoA reductase-like NAD-dependent aldehyde dehydrogenase
MVRNFTMTIGGSAATARSSFVVEDPATGEVLAEAPECSREQLDEAMRTAADAFTSWSHDARQRRRGLESLAAVVEANIEELADLITSEQGKPIAEARGELRGVLNNLRYFATLELPEELLRDDQRVTVKVLRRPVGPVAAITPWNFPLGTAVAKIAPALAAGCTIVLKPSPFTPLTCLRFGELTRDVLPGGVVNVLSGGNELGAAMVEHPVPRMVSFTGSVATGKRIAAAAAPDLKRLTLELGGNDPAIVLDDADVETVADGIFANAFSNCGQVCVAIKRVYAPERIYDEVVSALAERARAAKVGDGHLDGTEIGPLCNRMQFERVSGLVADALSGGGAAVTGGAAVDGPGYFYEPTVITGVSDGTRIVDEEQFGPALPVLSYRDVDEALARANATHFGLGASIWTSDPDRAAAVAPEVEAGTVWVNSHQSEVPGQPFGGLKWSGIGVEGGRWGLIGFSEIQTVYVARD